jgi:hypothetical protein
MAGSKKPAPPRHTIVTRLADLHDRVVTRLADLLHGTVTRID